jgi:hypothetical protein
VDGGQDMHNDMTSFSVFFEPCLKGGGGLTADVAASLIAASDGQVWRVALSSTWGALLLLIT